MRHSAYLSLALASLSILAAPLFAATRPRYGHTLRVETRTPVRVIDPADPATHPRIARLVFETLIRFDEAGLVQPGLAVSWQRDARRRHWQFRLRPEVRFHDGSPVTPAAVAASLSSKDWTATATADGVAIDSDHPISGLLTELVSIRHSIVLRSADGKVSGTGPFRLGAWEPGRRVVLNANDDYWAGRPFVDAVAIDSTRLPQEELLDLELGKVDLIELSANQVRRALQGNRKVWSSEPVTVLALVFERGRPAADNPRVREALAYAIDRAAISNVLLQKQSQPAGSLFPDAVTGYAFLFPATRDVARARRLNAPPLPLTLAYDGTDPLARSIADRIAVDAREAGLKLNPAASGRGDVRLVSVHLNFLTPLRAFNELAGALQFSVAAPVNDLETLYSAERTILDEYRIIPIAHLPDLLGVGPRVRTWLRPGFSKSGEWLFEDIWLDATQP
jgi:peptide/nickel transport system substrate-binding protein